MNYDELRERSIRVWEQEEQHATIPLIMIGTATCGLASGADELLHVLGDELNQAGVQADVRQVGCIGLCYAEPLVDVRIPGGARVCYGGVDVKKLRTIIEKHVKGGTPLAEYALGSIGPGQAPGVPSLWELSATKPQVRVVLRNCGIIDPDRLEHYVARGGYAGLVRALGMAPSAIIGEVKTSGLRGRGGAGFPTGLKWELCRSNAGDKRYVICNADEGDPGAFMDRSVLEGDPHAVLEGLCIAAYAIGASEGYIYCRAEYPLAIRRLRQAIEQAKEHRLIGEGILGSDFSFNVHIKEGAGAFVCGEETALIASIEGRRGMPRSRPPFPAAHGLFGRPTNINNVETLANVPAILREGAEWFANYGTEHSKGTKTFALAGKVMRTGLIEVPMGITLREVIFDVGGGIPDGKKFKAAQTGGPSGGCIPAEFLDLPIDYEQLARVGSIMGSGGLVILDESSCMVDLARYFINFTQNESCGKCIPCRLGTRQMLMILEDICAGRGTDDSIALLESLGDAVKKGSLCGLGQTAPNPALTTVRYFRDEYIEHVRDKVCRALSCKEYLRYEVIEDMCTACGVCRRECPSEAIIGAKDEIHRIDQSKCIRCGICFESCKFDSIRVSSGRYHKTSGGKKGRTVREKRAARKEVKP